jgi:REP element-mobilizing transposase RayT
MSGYKRSVMTRVEKLPIQQEIFGPRGGMRVLHGRSQPQRRKAKTAKRSAKAGGIVAPKRRRGRPRKGRFAGAPHKARPELSRNHPVHVTLRVTSAIGSLRKRFMYSALREATIAVAMRELPFKEHGAFRIVHISIQRDHVHLLVEADDKMALSRGMQSFQISAAKHLNSAFSIKQKLDVRRRGSVFPDRFHQEIIKTRKQARHALNYVLNNWRKHREDRGALQRTWNVDPFSSGAQFGGWKALEGQLLMWKLREGYQPLVVYLPRTWLLYEGWRMYGLITFDEVPSAAKSSPTVRTKVTA